MAADATAGRYDPGAPSTARVWNFWLVRGTSYRANYGTADEARAREIEQACPKLPQMAVDARLFSARAVTWAAAEGIGQFLELGCGLPPGPGIHDFARSVRPGSRVAYVDSDLAVTDELPGALGFPGAATAHGGLAVISADLRHPGRAMARRDLRAVIDPGEPACVLLTGVLHSLPPRQPGQVIAGYAARLAPGSLIAATAPVVPDELARERLARVYLPGTRYDVSPEEFAGWFGGLELAAPGIAAARHLRPGWREVPACTGHGPYVLAGIARVP